MIDEPPTGSSDPHLAAGSDVRPMSIAGATAWSSGIALTFWMLLVVFAPPEGTAENGDPVSSMACQALAYMLGLFLILRTYAPEASIRDFLGVRGTNIGFYPIAVMIGLAVQVPVQTLYGLITRRWPLPVDINERLIRLFAESSTAKRVLMGSFLVLLGPLVEEIFFRGAIFRPLLKRYPAVLVVTATSIFFSISHSLPQMFVPIAIVGAIMGYLRAKSGALGPSLALHMTFNAVPFYALFTAATEGTSSAEEEPLPPLWLTGVSVLATLVLIGAAHWIGARSATAAEARERDRR